MTEISGKSTIRFEKFIIISSSCKRSKGFLPLYPWSMVCTFDSDDRTSICCFIIRSSSPEGMLEMTTGETHFFDRRLDLVY